MIRSAVRTLSVLSLVTAVSGAAVVTQHHLAGDRTGALATDTLALPAGAGVRGQQAALAAYDSPGAATDVAPAAASAAAEAEVQSGLLGRQRRVRALHSRAVAQAKAEARAAARAAAKARAERAARLERARRSASRDPRAVARLMLAERGWSSQFGCLQSLWTKESGWNHRAMNPSSGAYGIPQALPGSKMASAGADWRSNPVTQIRWGLDYIADRYGSPCAAWGHSQATNWY